MKRKELIGDFFLRTAKIRGLYISIQIFVDHFSQKKSEEPAYKNFRKPPGQKAEAKISKYLTTNKVFRKF